MKADIVIMSDKARHRLKPNGVHTKQGGNWNKVWKDWIDKNRRTASKVDILKQMNKMRKDFGI